MPRTPLAPRCPANSAASARAGTGPKRLRIWSAGCSSGEEPYAIAIVLMEALRDIGSWDVKILATDLSAKVLNRAATDIYPADRVCDVPKSLLGRYFAITSTKPDAIYQVSESLRRMITFAHLNLMEQWPMKGPFDAIFCRNVMIYFDKDTQTRIVERFTRLLCPGGILFIGHSESLAGVKHNLECVEPTIYRRK